MSDATSQRLGAFDALTSCKELYGCGQSRAIGRQSLYSAEGIQISKKRVRQLMADEPVLEVK